MHAIYKRARSDHGNTKTYEFGHTRKYSTNSKAFYGLQ